MTAYADTADVLRDNGYHVIPIAPGKKFPADIGPFGWKPMSSWSRFCDHMPDTAQHERWLDMEGAGIGVAHGLHACCIDVDTDDEAFGQAVMGAAGGSPVRRKGSKGFAAYYRGNPALEEHGARVTWYIDEKPCLDLLLTGSQSVLPPSVHPSGQPYVWLTPDTLEDFASDELPVLPADVVERITKALEPFGATRRKPGRSRAAPCGLTNRDRLKTPSGGEGAGHARTLNERALGQLHAWFVELGLPKTRERAPGCFEAIPSWRSSGSGRAEADRNPNLKAAPTGIVDFGADVAYTPINLVMAALGLPDNEAISWLKRYFPDKDDGPKVTVDYDAMIHRFEQEKSMRIDAERRAEEERTRRVAAEEDLRAAIPEQDFMEPPEMGAGFRAHASDKRPMPSKATFERLLNPDRPFPIKGLDEIHGLLGDLARYIDRATTRRTDLGALAQSIPLIGALTPQYKSPTNLRTNIYTVALGASGTGKTQLRNAVRKLADVAQIEGYLTSGDFTSGAAVLMALEGAGENAKLAMMDEFGHVLQRLTNARAASHERDLMKVFTELFSAAGHKHAGKAYADGRQIEIDRPHLCLFGMATPGQFFDGFGAGALDDGAIARYVIMPVGESSYQTPDETGVEDVARSLRALADMRNGLPGDQEVRFESNAWARWIRLRDECEAYAEYCELHNVRGGPSIMRRVAEQAMKIAMISGIGCDWESPRVGMHDFEIGYAMAWYCAAQMIGNADNIVDNEFEQVKMEAYKWIKENDACTRTGMARKFRKLKRRELDDIISGLIEGGMIRQAMTQPEGGGRPSVCFHAQ